jgi:hypothetical protein
MSTREWQIDVYSKAGTKTLADITAWCESTFGPGGRNARYTWRKNWIVKQPNRFYFKQEKHAMLFALRWS